MAEINKEVFELFNVINYDNSIPKNIKEKMQSMQSILKEQEDIALKVNRVLQELDDLSETNNMPEHIRIQIWNLASLLESII